jgi:hypothetical protein
LILATVLSQNGIALALALSSIAATLWEGGRTAHSALKFPLNMQINETPTFNHLRNSTTANMLQQRKLIVQDECTQKIFGNIRPHVVRFTKEPKPVWWCNDFIGRGFLSNTSNMTINTS